MTEKEEQMAARPPPPTGTSTIPAVLSHVLLAEFDIDEGTCIRVQHPQPLAQDDFQSKRSDSLSTVNVPPSGGADEQKHLQTFLAEQMLPDGSEKFPKSSNVVFFSEERVCASRTPTEGNTQTALSLDVELYDEPLEREPGKGKEPITEAASGTSSTLGTGEKHGTERPTWIRVASDGSSPLLAGGGVFDTVASGSFSFPTQVFSRQSISFYQGTVVLYSGAWELLRMEASKVQLTLMPVPPEGVALPPGAASDADNEESFCFGLLRSAKRCIGILFTQPGDGVKLRDALKESTDSAGKDHSVSADTSQPFFGVNYVATKKDSTVRRGAINKALLLVGPNLHHLHALTVLAEEVLALCCEVKGASMESLAEQQKLIAGFFDAVNEAKDGGAGKIGSGGRTKPCVHPVQSECNTSKLMCTALRQCLGEPAKATVEHHCQAPWRIRVKEAGGKEAGAGGRHTQQTPHPTKVRYPLHGGYVDIPLHFFAAERFLTEIKPEDFTVLLNALFLRQRIVVLSQTQPAGTVSDAVLLLAMLVENAFPSVVRDRTFPYLSVSTVDKLLSFGREGFIAGTANPLFEGRTEWWDVLWSLDTMAVTCSSPPSNSPMMMSSPASNGGASPTAVANIGGSNTADEEFIDSTTVWIQQKRHGMAPETSIELGIRVRLVEYVDTIIRSAMSKPLVEAPEVALRFRQPNIVRCLSVQRSPLLAAEWSAIGDNAAKNSIATIASLVRHTAVANEIFLLQRLQLIVRRIQTEEEVLELLTYFPQALGGLAPIAGCMFHTSKAVQLLSVSILRLFDALPVGKQVIAGMNSFLMLGYEEAKRMHPEAGFSLSVSPSPTSPRPTHQR